MALLLIRRGGQVDIAPGHEVSIRAYSLKPFGLLATLKEDSAATDTWLAQCANVGIAGIDLGAVVPPSEGSANSGLSR